MNRREFLAVLGGGIVVLLVDDSDAQESGGGARRGTCCEPWWWTSFHAPSSWRKTLVATTAPTMASPPGAVERMRSTQTTHAKSPRTSMRSSATSKRMLPVLAKMVAHEPRTSAQPAQSGQPGCRQLTLSSCAHSRSIAGRSSASNAR